MGAAQARRIALLGGLLGGLLLGGCEEYGVDDTGSSIGADVNLIVSGFWNESSGAGHDFYVVVENTGTDPSGTFQVRIYLQDEEPQAGYRGDGQATVSNLEGGALETVVVNLTGAVPGELSWVVVDGADSVVELYEDDNVSGPSEIVAR